MSKYLLLIFMAFGQLYGQGVFHNISLNTNNPITDMAVDSQRNVWISTGNGVWHHSLYGQFSTFYDTLHGISSLPIHDLSVSSSGEIYLTGAGKTVFIWDDQTSSFSKLGLVTAKQFSHFTHVYHALGNTTYFGTDNGLVLTRNGTSLILQEKTQYSSAHNLGSITSISKTSDQSITAVLSTNGIILDIQGFILPVTAASLLPSDSVISGLMYRDVSYDGTNAGLYVADFSNGAPPSVNTFNTGNSGVPSNRIQALTAYGDSLFLGTDQGLAIYDLSSQTWMTLDKSNSNLPSNDVTHLAISSSGRLWIATADNNLSTWSAGLGLEEQNSEEPFYRLEGKDLYMDQGKVQGDLQIFSLSGQEVFSGKISEQISLEKLSSGIYFITVAEENGRYVLHDRIYLP